ncbi:MAG: hypothetical protein WC223_01040 [Bacteroidales bacterium]|jgi:uncharacterized protein YlxW (UPF0749 family)
MEELQVNQDHELNPENSEKKKKSGAVIFVIIIVLLLAGLGGLGWLYNQQKTEKESAIAKEKLITLKADSLLKEVEKLKSDLLTVTKERDSLNDVVIADYIKKLDAIKSELRAARSSGYGPSTGTENTGGGYAKSGFRAKYDALKKDYDNLSLEVGKLIAEKKQLQAERDTLKVHCDQLQTRAAELETQNKELTDKVTMGSVLSAYSIDAAGVRGSGSKEKATPKASKVQKIKVKFKVSKNLITPMGPKSAYIRILAPNGSVLAQGIDDSNKFKSGGEDLVFTIKRDYDYSNVEIELTTYFTPKEKLATGNYKVEIYSDSDLIGNTGFTLK